MRASWLALVALMALLASCGSDETNKNNNEGIECTEDWQCPSGSCENGYCSLFSGEDVGVQPTDDAASKDETPEQDVTLPPEDTTPEQDVTQPPEDVQTPQDVTKPGPTNDPDIGVYPTSHTFTYVPDVVNPQSTLIDIYNEGGSSLTIGKIYLASGSSTEYTIVALPPLPKVMAPFDQVSVMVVFKENSPHGPATLVIESNDPDEPSVEVTLNSQSKVSAQPCIQITPSALNFGSVQRGESKTLHFQVINCSDSIPLQVSKITRSTFFGMALSDEFQMTPTQPTTPFMLGPNQVLEQDLTFSPGLAGFDSGHFLFVNNDPTNGEAKLSVSGTGTPPPLEEIGLHIELEWDTASTDVDMHLLRPGAAFGDCPGDCFYGNMSPDWGVAGEYLDDPFLDYDDVDGYGPEHMNVQEPQAGVYKVVIHYYADSHEGVSGGASKATVRVYSYGVLLKEFGPTNLASTDMTWDVCTINWPSASITTLGNVYMGTSPGACFSF